MLSITVLILLTIFMFCLSSPGSSAFDTINEFVLLLSIYNGYSDFSAICLSFTFLFYRTLCVAFDHRALQKITIIHRTDLGVGVLNRCLGYVCLDIYGSNCRTHPSNVFFECKICSYRPHYFVGRIRHSRTWKLAGMQKLFVDRELLSSDTTMAHQIHYRLGEFLTQYRPVPKQTKRLSTLAKRSDSLFLYNISPRWEVSYLFLT